MFERKPECDITKYVPFIEDHTFGHKTGEYLLVETPGKLKH